jgi:hypothetical protein
MPNWSVLQRIIEAVVLLVVGALVNRFFEKRPKLIQYLRHSSAVVVRNQDSEMVVNLHTLVVTNLGRKAAINVRVGHYTLPNYSVFPQTQHTVETLPGGGREIVFPVLRPQQEVSIQYLYYPPLFVGGVNSHVYSDEGIAKNIDTWHVKRYAPWVNFLIVSFMLIGAITVMFGLWWLIAHNIGSRIAGP